MTSKWIQEGKRRSRLLGNMQQYLQRINFPANKEEVASGGEGNGAPRDFVGQIRNAATEHFNSPEEVLHAVQGAS